MASQQAIRCTTRWLRRQLVLPSQPNWQCGKTDFANKPRSAEPTTKRKVICKEGCAPADQTHSPRLKVGTVSIPLLKLVTRRQHCAWLTTTLCHPRGHFAKLFEILAGRGQGLVRLLCFAECQRGERPLRAQSCQAEIDCLAKATSERCSKIRDLSGRLLF